MNDELDRQQGRPDAGQRGFRRSGRDRYLGGVAAGLARQLGVDPLIVRIGWVVATLWWPFIPLVYAGLWLAVPDDESDRSLLGSARGPGGLRRVIGVGALGVGAAAFTPGFRGDAWEARFGLLLLVVGAVLVLGRSGDAWPVGGGGDDDHAARSGGPPSPEDAPAGPVPPEPPATDSFPPGTSPPEPPPTGPPPPGSQPPGVPPRGAPPGRPESRSLLERLLPGLSAAADRGDRPRPRAWLGWLTLWAVVLLAGVALALDRLEIYLKPGLVVSLALLLVAAGLLVGAFYGRARLLIAIGALLVPLWLAFGLGGIDRYEGEGRLSYTPASRTELRDRYELGYGRLSLDLTRLDWDPGTTTEIPLGMTAGLIEVWVPRDVDVRLDMDGGVAHADIASIYREDDGWWWELSRPQNGTVFQTTRSLAAPARPPTCRQVVPWDEPEPWDDRAPGDEPEPAEPVRPVHEDPAGRPCVPEEPPAAAAVLRLDVRIGVGNVEVRHVETPG